MRLEPGAIPPEIMEVLHQLNRAGFQALLVGGCVRDYLRGCVPSDFDIATSARPEQVQRLFRRTIPTGLAHGTVTVLLKDAKVEVTTFRTEGDYVDGRRPTSVTFHDNVDADLSRRDFTINAMAWEPGRGLVDPFGGQADLEGRLIRCVGEPRLRFEEDGLRPLRAVRFAATLDFALAPGVEEAIAASLAVFEKVSAERIRVELEKILLAEEVARGLELLDMTHLFDRIAPSVARDFSKVARAPAKLPVRLAALLFANVRVRELLIALTFPNAVVDDVVHLIAHRELPGPSEDAVSLRRYLAKVGRVHAEDAIALALALGTGTDAVAQALAVELNSGVALSLKELRIDGKGVMEAMGIPASPAVGEALKYLLGCVLEDPSRNSRAELVGLLRARQAGS